MGIMTRLKGEKFIITSDRNLSDAPSRAPKVHTDFPVAWTGTEWSTTLTDAMPFASEEEADEYTRANYARLSGTK
jgi:hypothetical protein